jgi:2,3-bisphosphoglycerate-independent phosphoglycerate mutase
MNPVLLLILDGAADLVGGADSPTPLERAETPGLDLLAREGHAGMLYPVNETIAPESHVGILNLLGYELLPSEVPRGPLEALGSGLDFQNGDLALRVNFGTRDDVSHKIIDRRMCRTLELAEAETLCASITDAVNQANSSRYLISLKAIHSYRACAVIHSSSSQLSDRISNTDPAYPTEDRQVFSDGYESILCLPLEDTREAQATSAIVNDFVAISETVLSRHSVNAVRRARGDREANVILTRGPGIALPALSPLSLKYRALPCFLGDLPIELGVGVLVGCKCVEYSPQTDSETPYADLLAALKEVLLPDSLVIAHIKGPDEFGHDGDYLGKVRSIHLIDHYVVCPLLADLRQVILAVTSDHATPCARHVHTADAVPFAIRGFGVPRNGAEAFNERACSRLRSPIRRGIDLLPSLFRFLQEGGIHVA